MATKEEIKEGIEILKRGLDMQADDIAKLLGVEAPALDNFRCPKCGHEDADGGSAEIEHNQAWQRMYCSECKAEWTDVYTLTNQIMDETEEEG